MQETVGALFEDLTISGSAADAKVEELVREVDIALALSAVDLIEDWCSAIRAEAERRLHQGVPVTGYKLVARQARSPRLGRRQGRRAAAAREVPAHRSSRPST
jgi:hypothetical protein